MEKAFRVGVRSFLYKAGATEDGADFEAEAYQVVVTFPCGYRVAHPRTFAGCELVDLGEGVTGFCDVRDDAAAAAKALAAKVEAKGSIDIRLWLEVPAVYGSESWNESAVIAVEAA